MIFMGSFIFAIWPCAVACHVQYYADFSVLRKLDIMS